MSGGPPREGPPPRMTRAAVRRAAATRRLVESLRGRVWTFGGSTTLLRQAMCGRVDMPGDASSIADRRPLGAGRVRGPRLDPLCLLDASWPLEPSQARQ